MAQQYDVTLKHLLETWPGDWLRLIGLPATGPVEVLDADLATISAEADKIFRLSTPEPYLLHIEMQSTYERDLPDRMHVYNTLIHRRHGLAVRSVVLLLRPSAGGPALTGTLERHWPDGRRYLEFVYDIVPVWKLPVEGMLAGGPGVLPLAPLSDEAPSQLERVVRDVERQLVELPRSTALELWAATYLLMGLRYPVQTTETVFRGVSAMLRDVLKDSSTYQALIERGRAEGLTEGREEGRVEGARDLVLRTGTRKFGEPDDAARQQLEAIRDLDQLSYLVERISTVFNWAELLHGSDGENGNGYRGQSDEG